MSTPSEHLLHRLSAADVSVWDVDPLASALASSEDNGHLPAAYIERLYGPLAAAARAYLGLPAWTPPASTTSIRTPR